MKVPCSRCSSAIRILLVMVCIASMPAMMWGQSTTGSIVGTVTDPSGAVIPSVAVTLTNIGTADKRTAETDANGAYRFMSLIPSNYRLDFEISGFKHLTRESVTLQVEAVVRIDAALEVGDVKDTIEVTAETPLLQTDSSTVSSVVEAKNVQEMPLNGRNVMNLIALVPGVVPQGATAGTIASNQSAGHTNNAAFNNYQIGGGLAGHSSSYLDGAPTVGLGGNSVQLIATQDAVQEFRVATNNIGPEYGRFGGGVVNMATKSGTNQWHGSAYEYFRNTVLNSNDFFANRSGTGRPAFNQNQYGGTLGGPIRKDKTFFFFSWEQFRAKIGQTINYGVPTAAQKRGDFSADLGAVIPGVTNPCDNNNPVRVGQIFDAMTTQIIGGRPCRTPFAGNIIPANRIDYAANAVANVIKYWPEPNSGYNNYASNFNPGGNQQQFDARVDETLSENHRFFTRFTYWTVDDIGANKYNNLTAGAASHQHTHQAVLGDSYSFSPTLMMENRLSFTRGYYDDAPQHPGFDLSQYGPAWATLQSQVSIAILMSPVVNLMNEGNGNWSGLTVVSAHYRNTWALSSNLTKMAGRHTIKFGGEIRLMDYDYLSPQNASGQFGFNYDLTSYNNANSNGGGYPVASFMLGYAGNSPRDNSAPRIGTASPISQYSWYQGYYVGDTFQANSKLTLNYGVRWELPGGYAEKHDRATILLPDKKDPLADSVPSMPNLKGQLAFVNSDDWSSRYTQEIKHNLFSPRVGFAYRIFSSTVLRGGYGLNYLPMDVNNGAAPSGSLINSNTTNMVAMGSGGAAAFKPLNTLSNPFPLNGVPGTIQQSILQPDGRNYKLSSLEGLAISGPIVDQPFGYGQQWNFGLQKELKAGLLFEVGYMGARALHVPTGISLGLNQLNSAYFSLRSALNASVPNPFAGLVNKTGSLNGATTTRGQLLRPYPQFSNVQDTSAHAGSTQYHSMQVRVEKRFGSAGMINANYTWAKNTGNVDSQLSFLEGSAVAAYQDYNNVAKEWSMSSFDVASRFVASYVLELPIGKGKKFASGTSGVVGALISGWAANGIITLQDGYPLAMKAGNNDLRNYGVGVIRPNYVPGCVKEFSGRAQDRLSQWFNTSCFIQPADTYSFGGEARTDPQLRSHGVNNFDFTMSKNTKIKEALTLQFKAEFFNVFNRVQFRVDQTTVGGTFGTVREQWNKPRLVQFALRLVF
jgi:hypothetical protein